MTALLEKFGRLVYKRLLTLANEERKEARLGALPRRFGSADVLEKTRMRARNWFGKLASIRTVVPRLYGEFKAEVKDTKH